MVFKDIPIVLSIVCVIFYFTIDKIENLLMLPSPEMLKIIKMSVTKAAHWTQLKLTQVCFLSRVQSASVNVSLLNHLIVMPWSSLYDYTIKINSFIRVVLTLI